MGKERLFRALKGEDVEQLPWVPFAGIHAGKIKSIPADELLKDEDKLFECLLEVNKQYHPDGQPIMFDLQIEAEILGCKLKWLEKSPPVVDTHPLKNKEEIPSKIPQKNDGRLPMYLNVMKRLKSEVGDSTALFALVTGPLTLASHLRGTNLYMDMIRNKDYTKKLLNFTKKVAIEVSKYYIETGMDVIAIVDPVVSQVSPRTFEEILTDPFSDIFKFLKKKDVFSSFFVCGDATKNIDLMCKTNPDSIFIDENIDLVEAKKITDKYNITIGGNIPLTTVMLHGSQQDNMKYIVDLLDEFKEKKISKNNFIVAPGCDMPYDVPPENVVGVLQAIQDTDGVRNALKDYKTSEIDIEIQLPDYNNLDKPLIEVFTIDSDVCAACGYMKELAFSAKEKFGDSVDVVEYKWTKKENIMRTKVLGLKHLPCLLINGQLKYSSIIPDQEEYFNEIEKVL